MRDPDSLYSWILKILRGRPGDRLLDVASGEGVLLRLAVRAGFDTWGIDLSTAAMQITKLQVPQARVVRGEGETLPWADALFDYVTNLGSLEHFLDPVRGVREMARVLKPTGLCCVLLPNSYYVLDIAKVWITGRGPNHGQEIERFATRSEWRNLLESNGLQVVRVYKYNRRLPVSIYDVQWYLSRPARILKLLIAPLVPLNLSYSFIFLCRKLLPVGES
jgi:ubiquinone/menaquinone biosynthesis C-methylase UbiE